LQCPPEEGNIQKEKAYPYFENMACAVQHNREMEKHGTTSGCTLDSQWRPHKARQENNTSKKYSKQMHTGCTS